MKRIAAKTERLRIGFFVLFSIYVIALFFDAFTTSLFMIRFGHSFELHPGIRYASEIAGPIYGPVIGAVFKSLVGFLIIMIHRPLARVVLPAATILSLFAGIYNLAAWPLYQTGYLPDLPF